MENHMAAGRFQSEYSYNTDVKTLEQKEKTGLYVPMTNWRLPGGDRVWGGTGANRGGKIGEKGERGSRLLVDSSREQYLKKGKRKRRAAVGAFGTGLLAYWRIYRRSAASAKPKLTGKRIPQRWSAVKKSRHAFGKY